LTEIASGPELPGVGFETSNDISAVAASSTPPKSDELPAEEANVRGPGATPEPASATCAGCPLLSTSSVAVLVPSLLGTSCSRMSQRSAGATPLSHPLSSTR
jgi:hypothetical protein